MCLEVFDVIFGDTRDPSGAERFLQLSLHNLYRPYDYQSTLRAFFQSKPVRFVIFEVVYIFTVEMSYAFNENFFKGA
jgi:hypothetical protein